MSKEEQKIEVKRILDPIKTLVTTGRVSEEAAIDLLTKQIGKFSGKGDTLDYKKFRENSNLIYKDELFIDIGYRLVTGKVYKFLPASQHDVHTLYKIWQYLSGKEYGSQEQLRELMHALLDGKKILELGCGPGFNLKVLQNLGAKVSGVEIVEGLVGRLPEIDVKYGDAENLDNLFGDEEFDIIYSRDLFCTAIMDQEKAAKLAKQMWKHTKINGFVMHQITYEKMEIPIYLMAMWLYNRKIDGDFKKMEEDFWNNRGEFEKELFTNRCSLDIQDLVIHGFRLIEYSIENGELNIVLRK